MIKIGKKAVFLFSFLSSFAFAQEGVVVQATTDRDKVEVNQTFTVDVIVQSSESVDVEDPHLPTLTDFELVQQFSNTSVQQSLVQTPNGMDWKTVRKQQFSYMFQAKKEGRLSVDAFEVVVNGKLFRTQPIMIEVFPEGQGPVIPRAAPRARPSLPGFEDEEEDWLREQEEIFNQLLQNRLRPAFPSPQPKPGMRGHIPEPEYRSMPTNPNEAFFIQLEADKKSVYEGEQITVSWYLLTRGQLETLDRVKFPDLKGFWKEIIEENPQIQFYEEIINGVVYRKALMASHALFPIKSGKAIIDEFTVKSRVRMPSRGFGFGRAYEYTKSSKRLEIEVKPLPLDGRPAHFTGAVGEFDVNVVAETQKVSLNQPFSVRVRFEGYGNAKSIELPKIEWPEGLELYDTKNESKFFKDGRSYKEFEVLLIPRKSGAMEIPAIDFAFFNPKTEKYEQKTTAPISLEVADNGTADLQGGKNFLGKATEVKKVLSLPAIMETAEVASPASKVPAQTAWALSYLLSAAGLLGYGWKELRPQNRAVSLRKMLDQQWKKVDQAMAGKNPRQVGAEIVNAFNLVLSEITSHKGEILELSKMLEKLSPEVREKYSKLVSENYETAQLLSFAPDSVVEKAGQAENLNQLVKNSRQVLNALAV